MHDECQVNAEAPAIMKIIYKAGNQTVIRTYWAVARGLSTAIVEDDMPDGGAVYLEGEHAETGAAMTIEVKPWMVAAIEVHEIPDERKVKQ